MKKMVVSLVLILAVSASAYAEVMIAGKSCVATTTLESFEALASASGSPDIFSKMVKSLVQTGQAFVLQKGTRYVRLETNAEKNWIKLRSVDDPSKTLWAPWIGCLHADYTGEPQPFQGSVEVASQACEDIFEAELKKCPDEACPDGGPTGCPCHHAAQKRFEKCLERAEKGSKSDH